MGTFWATSGSSVTANGADLTAAVSDERAQELLSPFDVLKHCQLASHVLFRDGEGPQGSFR